MITKAIMSHFDPDLRYFANASGYRNTYTNHESKFRVFRDFVVEGRAPSSEHSPFVIQFVCHPNFGANLKTVTYYELVPDGFEARDQLPSRYRRANSYKNYKSALGHPKGLFYELNLYTKDAVSTHNTSRVTGSHFARDDSHDMRPGHTKGAHWLE